MVMKKRMVMKKHMTRKKRPAMKVRTVIMMLQMMKKPTVMRKRRARRMPPAMRMLMRRVRLRKKSRRVMRKCLGTQGPRAITMTQSSTAT